MERRKERSGPPSSIPIFLFYRTLGTDQMQFLLKLLLPFACPLGTRTRRSWGSPLETDAREPEISRESGEGGGGGEEEEEDEWKERGDAGNRRRPEIKREQPCQGRDGRIKREISNRSSCDSYFSRSMDDRESLPRKRSSNAIPRTRRGESKRLKSFVSASKVFDIRRSRARFDY